MKQITIGVWHPRFDDRFNRPVLLKLKEFFLDDLERAEASVLRIEKFSSMKLTPSKKGFTSMISIAKEGVKQSKQNIKTVNQILKMHP